MQIKLKKKIIETHHKNRKEIQLDAIKVVLSLYDVRISVVKFTFNNFLITCVFVFKIDSKFCRYNEKFSVETEVYYFKYIQGVSFRMYMSPMQFKSAKHI